MLLEVLDAVLTQPVFAATDQPSDQIFGVLRDICNMGGELEPLLWEHRTEKRVRLRYWASFKK